MNIINNFDFKIINATKHYCQPHWSWISDTNGWTGFHLWIVVSGGAKVQVRQEEYELVPGDFFLFDLSFNHKCFHNPQNPLVVLAIYFHTKEDEKFRRDYMGQLVSPKKSVGNLALNISIFNHIQEADNQVVPYSKEMWFQTMLIQLLDEIKLPQTTNEYVNKVCMEISAYPERKLSLDEICAKGGYSKNHFIRLFKQQMNSTPYEYYINVRIEKVKELILYSNMSFTEIAENLNFSDLNHLSKQFYKKTGLTLGEYRK